MTTTVVNLPIGSYHVAAIPYEARMCFEVCELVFANEEVKILMYEAFDECPIHTGGVLVIQKPYQEALIESHQTYRAAKKNCDYWINYFLRQFWLEEGENKLQVDCNKAPPSKRFASLAPRKIPKDAIIDMRFCFDPKRSYIRDRFAAESCWRSILLDWAASHYAKFNPLFNWDNQVTASMLGNLFIGEWSREAAQGEP